MNVEAILQDKGYDVATISPDASIATVLANLKSVGVGALVVSSDGQTVSGILSERDIVRGLAKHGPSLLEMKAADLMTKEVTVCTPQMTVDECMMIMTDSRIRHLPVVVDGTIKGIVSIGDVVKARLGELKHEAEALREYIAM
jgi:CBS domain-containing protein